MRNNLVRSVWASNFFATPRRRWRLFAPRHKMSKVMVALALIVSTIFLTSTAQAQTYKAMPLDGGGWTSGFAQANNGRLYAYGDVFGAWRSDDGGNNWSYLNWSIPGGDIVGLGMAVEKANADVVYYSTYNAIYKSTDGGNNWVRLLDDLAWGLQAKDNRRFRGSSQIMIRSNNTNEIWFAGPRKNLTGWLWKSSNGGQDWVKAGGSNFDSNKARTLHNVATFANQIWVGSDNGLYVSTDGGTSFNLVGNSSSLTNVGMISRFTSGTFAGVGLVTRANNNGGGISRITATNYNDASTYSVNDAATYAIYFGYPTGLQIFSDGSSSAWNTSGERHGFSPAGDGGQTFTVRATTLNTNPTPIWTTAAIMANDNHPNYGTDQVIEDVNNPNKWIITGGGAAMYSLDKGFSWQYFPNASGIAAVKTYRTDVSRYDANRMYVPASDIGSVIVTDGGASGQASLSSCKFFTKLHGSHRVMEGPNTQDLVIAGVNQGACASILLKSSDGGNTWNNFNLSGTGLPLSYDGICKSVMSINDANDFLVSLASDGTADDRSSIPPNSINPGVWRTTNGGTSFNQVTGLPGNLDIGIRYGPQNSYIERDATQANVRYFVSRHIGNSPTASTQFYRSTTNGASWSPVNYIFGTGGWVWGLCADPIRSNTLWAAGGGFGVKVSTNGGDTWTPTSQFFDAKHVSSCDGKIAVWGRKDGEPNPELLWYSADNGVTWAAQSTVANNFHNIQGITVDRNGRIWVSWNSITVVTPIGGTPPPVDTQAPTVPTSLSSASITQSSFTLNWAASTDNVGVTAYEVFRGGVSQGTVTGTSFNATGLSASTSYSMTVRARDAAGNNSAQSTALNVTTSAPSGDTQAPTVPTGLSSASITQTSFTLNWSASTDNVGVTAYEVFRGGVSQGTVTGTSFNATGLSAGTSYSMTVRARDAAGNNSAQSTALNITTSASVNGTLFTGTVTGTAAYNNEAQYAVANVFDGNINTFFAPANTNSFAQLDLGTTLTGRLSTLRFYPRVGFAARMVGGVFQASTNGTTWTNIYSVSATPSEAWNTIAISDANFYRYFRFYEPNDYADVSEIEFLGTTQSVGGGDTQAPTVPTGLSSASITQTSFTLNWAASTDNVGVTAYEVFRGGVSQGTVTGTSFTATGLSASTTYSMTVRARDAAGNNSAQSTALSVTTTDTTAPTVPTSLTSTSITQTSFTLNWAASTDNVGVTAYEVFRGGVSQGTVTGTSFNATGLSASATYSMTVRARDAAGNNSAQSTALNITTSAPAGDTQAPTVPSSLSSASITQTSFTLNWAASTDNVGVTAYEVFRGGVSQGTVTGTSFTATGLSASTTYSMTVRARDAAGNNSAQSTALNVTTSAASGGNFPIITARGENLPNEGDDKAFDLDNNSKWLDFSATSFLQIQYATATVFNQYVMVSGNDAPERDPRNWTIEGSNNGTNWTVLNSQSNQTWANRNQARTFSFTNNVAYAYYKLNITANNGGSIIQLSELTYSNVGGGSDTQAPTVPTSLSSASVTQTSFTLNWAASTDNVGVTAYEVFRGGVSQGTVTGTSFNATGLSAGTTYSMTVRARDAAGNNSAQSTALSVTTNPAPQGLNLGFESDFTGWGTYGTASITTTPANVRSGAKAGFFSNGGGNFVVTGLSPNTTYAVRGWAKVATGTDVWITVSGFGGSQVGAQMTSTNWTQSGNIVFTTGAGVTSATLSTWTGATSSAFFDDYTIAPFSAISNNVTLETWTNISGTSVTDIPLSTTPNTTATITSLETTSNVGDNYGVRIRGYIVPSTTGNYTFYIASDDNGEFYLSTDNQPINSTLACRVLDWTDSREWAKDPTNQTSTSKSLVAGQRYYFRALMKEGSGGDNLAIGWTGPGISTITVIGAANLDRYIPSGAPGELSAPNSAALSSSVATGVAIYPNPASNSFNVSSDDAKAKISITSLEGKLMKSVTAKDKLTTIDSSNWAAGVYIINVESNNQATIKKIVIAK